MMLMVFLGSFYLVDQPDILIPQHGRYDVQLRFGPVGEIIGYSSIDLWDRLSIGVSYGAANLIGAGDPDFYTQPGVQARVLALEPSAFMPAVAFGFDNQGYGGFNNERYYIMSKGLYCQVGEIFDYPGLTIVSSLGINYCFEDDGRLDMFGGVKFQLGSSTQFLVDYSPNFNDELDQNKGYLNFGLRFVFYDQLFFEFSLRDLLDNGVDTQLNRMIKIGYQAQF
jgi:hypothetical protein